MKKLAICSLSLAIAVMFVPQSQAAPRSIHFTNFCDCIEYDTANVGGVTGTELWGGWDYLCIGEFQPIAGNGGAKLKLGTYVGYMYNFTFSKSDHLFDLYSSNGLSGGALALQLNQPWTQTNGSCSAADPERKGKPRLIESLGRD